MARGSVSRLKKFYGEARALWEERGFEGEFQKHAFYKFLHFLVLVARSFVRNRCPSRASALAYTTLLALIPLLAVGIGVSTALLKKEGVEDKQIVQTLSSIFVDKIAPQLGLIPQATDDISGTNKPPAAATEKSSQEKERNIAEKQAEARRKVAERIGELITNARSGTLNVAGAIGLILVAVGLLSTIEATFNDIWGIKRGRSWFSRLIYYWSAITFVPLLILLGAGLSVSSRFQAAHDFISSQPILGALVFSITPYIILVVVFMLIYMFMPNTRVRWKAALLGAVVAAVLWQLNSRFNVFFASKVVSVSSIYRSLSVLPVFLIGLYFSWLIVLLGSQIAYALQNLDAYLQQRQSESVNQRGREFVAFRLMTLVGKRFHNTQPPASAQEIATELGVPARLLHQLVEVLVPAGLIAGTDGQEERYIPARPLDKITAHDILRALRTCNGQELATRDEPSCQVVRGEFEKIVAAERREASGLTLLTLVQETETGRHEDKLA